MSKAAREVIEELRGEDPAVLDAQGQLLKAEKELAHAKGALKAAEESPQFQQDRAARLDGFDESDSRFPFGPVDRAKAAFNGATEAVDTARDLLDARGGSPARLVDLVPEIDGPDITHPEAVDLAVIRLGAAITNTEGR